jgi:hypothetical protein
MGKARKSRISRRPEMKVNRDCNIFIYYINNDFNNMKPIFPNKINLMKIS